jgi:ribosomal protein L2
MKHMRIISLLAASNSRTQLKTKSILSKSVMLMASLGLSKQAEARESEIIKHKDDNQTTSSELSNQGEDKAIVEKVTAADLEEDQLSNNLNQAMLGNAESTELGVILLAQNDVSPSVESNVSASYDAVDNTPSKAHVTDVATGGLSNMAVTGIVAGGLIAWAATAKHVDDESNSRVVNDAPSDIKLSSKQINENQSGVVVGSLTTIDANDAATSYGQHTYTVDDARFEVVNNQLKLKAGVSLDHEAAGTLNVTVTATDGGGLAKSQVFAITVSDVNEAPTAVTLNSGTSATVAENAVAAALGAISTSDADSATTSNGQHTYTVDDARFEVVNNQLKLKAGVSLDHEAAGTLNVTVTATDGGGLAKSQVFAITVSDVNEAPTAVTLNSGTSATVAENAVAAALGAISTSDADSATTSNGQHTYTVDDARFEVVNNQLKLKAGVSLDHEAAGTLNVTVTATDGGGLAKSQVFAITVSDVNEAPTAVTLNSGTSATVAENAVAAALGAISTSDADSATTSNGQHTYTVDDARFEVVNNQLKLKAGVSLDHEAAGTLNVTVTATDGGGLAKSQVFAITVSDVNEAPTAVTLNSGSTSASVAENAVAAALGAISTSDADSATTSNGQHTYTVDDARFEVVNNQLKLKAGVSLDHEAAGTLNVTVTATDGGGLAKSQVFAITVSDVKELVSLTGTVNDDGFNYATSLDNFVVNSLAGNDVITTGAGNDMVRPGEGADNVNTGAANDVIVVVGQTAANQYTQKDIKNPANSGIDVSSVVSLDTLNNRSTSELQAGEHIDGGAGVNHLIVYGETDLTVATIANIQQIHVNSTLTLSAQQFNTLPLTMLLGNGDSTLKLSSIGNVPIVVDLSKVQLLDFKTVSIGEGVTLIADQTDINSLKYITGDGVLKASTSADVLNLTGKTISVDVQNKDGMIHTTHGATIVSGDIIIGSELSDTLNGSSIADRLEGGGGNDTLTGGDGNDIIRGGAGVDKMDGGAGDDTFVVVGDLSGGGKVDSLADTAALAEGLTNFNGKNLNEDEDGAVETIIGGAGDDTLYVYGSADISKYDLSGIEHIELRSDVPLNVEQLQGVSTLSGDGSSILRIVKVANSPAGVVELDLSTLDLSNLAEIFIDTDVVLKISSLEDLGGARILTGAGTLKSANGTLVLPNTFSIQNTLHVDQIDATQADKLTEIFDKSSVGGIIDSSGNDYLRGTDYEDVLTSVRGGNDVLTGKKGSDTFRIAGEGKKIILDVDNKNDESSAKDTLDFSLASGAAQVDLTSGGTVGGATIQLGSGSATGGTQQTASKFNLMLIVDVSGSMGYWYWTHGASKACSNRVNQCL